MQLLILAMFPKISRARTAAIIRAENAAKITQRSWATSCHIRRRARETVTGSASILTWASSSKLHQLPPGKTDRMKPIHLRSLSTSSRFSSPWRSGETRGAFWTENPLMEADFGGGKTMRRLGEAEGLGADRQSLMLAIKWRRFRWWVAEGGGLGWILQSRRAAIGGLHEYTKEEKRSKAGLERRREVGYLYTIEAMRWRSLSNVWCSVCGVGQEEEGIWEGTLSRNFWRARFCLVACPWLTSLFPHKQM